MANLTDKQQRFCEEYLVDLNATQAALRAGYCASSVNKSGPRLLVNVGIQNEIQRLKAQRSERTQIQADAVVTELAKVAFSNIQDYLTVWASSVSSQTARRCGEQNRTSYQIMVKNAPHRRPTGVQ